MNVKKIILMMATTAMFVACQGEKKSSSESEEATAVETTAGAETAAVVTNEAGTALIQELYSKLYKDGNSRSDVEKYLGDALIAKLNEQDGEMPLIDYDPFINAQDYDAASVMNSLKITELSEGHFQVEVEPMSGSKTILELTLGLDDAGVLKVLDIPSDPNISVLK